MCVVSMVSDHYMRRWPNYYEFPVYEYENYQELLRKARLYDEMMNQPDCPAPDKVDWQKRLEKVMQEKYGLKPKIKRDRPTR